MIHKNEKFNQIDLMKILKVKMKSKSKKSLLSNENLLFPISLFNLKGFL